MNETGVSVMIQACAGRALSWSRTVQPQLYVLLRIVQIEQAYADQVGEECRRKGVRPRYPARLSSWHF